MKEKEMYQWLTRASLKTGKQRIQRLSWKKIAEIFTNAKTGGIVRDLIIRECRRCGYTPKTILTIH